MSSAPPKLPAFKEFTEDEVSKTIKSMPTKMCELVPIPLDLLKKALPSLLTIITNIVNTSLRDGVFATSWKTALVKPILKKLGLDIIKSNYRLVSNLTFISKVVEKCVLLRFNSHCDIHHLMPDYQSAYHSGYSCETALLKLTNNVLWNMEHKMITPPMAIDLSATFDTVDTHDILLNVLQDTFGLEGTAVQWFESYLRPRNFKVQINDSLLEPADLPFCILQGSMAGPVAYSAYASTLKEVIPPQVDLHGYADDHIYKKGFLANSREAESETMGQLENCASVIKIWMDGNRLKMNDKKTEFIMFGSRKLLPKCHSTAININGDIFSQVDLIRYLGAGLDASLSFKHHIKVKCKASMFNLVRIIKIRPYLTQEACNVLVMELVISHLDYGNSVLMGLAEVDTDKLQRVQNIAAKVVLMHDKCDNPRECVNVLH